MASGLSKKSAASLTDGILLAKSHFASDTLTSRTERGRWLKRETKKGKNSVNMVRRATNELRLQRLASPKGRGGGAGAAGGHQENEEEETRWAETVLQGPGRPLEGWDSFSESPPKLRSVLLMG